MTLQASGAISLSDIQGEFGGANPISLSEYYGAASGVPASGAISFSDFYGTSSVIEHTSAGTRTSITIAADFGNPTEAGNYVWTNTGDIRSGSSGTYAVKTGSFPAGSTLKIVNQGYIRGRGGKGGSTSGTSPSAGSVGQDALQLNFAVTLDNGAGYIYGGGGGGGGSYTSGKIVATFGGGGGAGSNAGGGGSATNGATNYPGSAGSLTAGGGGGSSVGGDGGGLGANGQSSSGGASNRAGGAAGKAIEKNGYACTITAGNTSTRIKGAVS